MTKSELTTQAGSNNNSKLIANLGYIRINGWALLSVL